MESSAAIDAWRRRILIALGGTVLPFPVLAGGRKRLLSPVDADDGHAVAGMTMPHSPSVWPLPMRGHGLAVDPRNPDEVLVIARRPGTTAVRFNLQSGQIRSRVDSLENRHFFGHACFSADGRHAYFTENDIDTGQGLVTVRDGTDLRLLDEWPSHGIGPHELILMPDGQTLAVANGGILTLPETGRVKRNLGNIESSLVYLDANSGRLLGKYSVPSRQLSLRHLAVTPFGRIAAALQFEGSRSQTGVQLLMFHQGSKALEFAAAPGEDWDGMRHYAASVAYDPASDRFALSCPVGNRLACWSSAGVYAGSIEVPRVSGIAFSKDAGYATNEAGQVFDVDLERLSVCQVSRQPNVRWDNHLVLG